MKSGSSFKPLKRIFVSYSSVRTSRCCDTHFSPELRGQSSLVEAPWCARSRNVTSEDSRLFRPEMMAGGSSDTQSPVRKMISLGLRLLPHRPDPFYDLHGSHLGPAVSPIFWHIAAVNAGAVSQHDAVLTIKFRLYLHRQPTQKQ